jgi:hypothetical protein
VNQRNSFTESLHSPSWRVLISLLRVFIIL